MFYSRGTGGMIPAKTLNLCTLEYLKYIIVLPT